MSQGSVIKKKLMVT